MGDNYDKYEYAKWQYSRLPYKGGGCNYRKRLDGMRKAVIDSVVFQRQLQERMYFDAFGETMEEALNRRFDGKHVIL